MKQETTSIERLFRQHYTKMYHLARYILFDADECQDVVSDVFAHILEDGIVLLPGTEEAFLLCSVRNRCLNLIAHKSVKERVARLLFDDATIGTSEDDDERLDRLMHVIDRLEPPLRRQILRLRHLQEMSYQEIANTLGVSKVTVYNHLSQAMDTIRELFKTAKR